MRRIEGAMILGLLLAACGGEDTPPPKAPAPPTMETPPPPPEPVATTPPPAPKPTMAEMQQAAMKSWVDAMNAHDVKKIGELHTESAVMKMAGMPDATGRDAIQASMQKLFDAFTGMKVAPNFFFMKDDVVVSVWTANATHGGEFMGLKATEKPIGVTGASALWFNQDGHIKEAHVFWDPATVMAQAGAMKGAKARPVPSLPASPQVITAKGDDTETKNLDAAKKSMEAFEAKKEADWLATVADNIEWDDNTAPGPMVGKDSAKKYFKEMTKAFPDAKSTPTNRWAMGDFVIEECTFTGTQKAPFMGMPAQKKPVTMHSLNIVMMKDGKIQKGWSFGNAFEMMPPPDAAKMKAAPAGKAGDKAAAPAKPADKGTAKPADKAAAPAKPADKGAAKPADKK